MKRMLLVVLLALAVVPGVAWDGNANAAPEGREGPEVAQARAHFKAGERAFNAGDYAKALAAFEAGYALVPRPGFLLNMAHTERRLGHDARARELYRRYLDAEPGSGQRDEVLGLIAELDRALGTLAPVPEPSPPSSESPPGVAEPVTPAPLPAAPEPSEPPAPMVSAPSPSARPDDGAAAADGSPSPSPPAARPLHRRWWFWVALGAVAAGTTTAVIVGTRSTGPSFQSDGSLGRVGGP